MTHTEDTAAAVRAWCDSHANLLDATLIQAPTAADLSITRPPIPAPAWASELEVDDAGDGYVHVTHSTTLDVDGVSATIGQGQFIDRATGAVENSGDASFLVKFAGGGEAFAASPDQARALIGVLQSALALTEDSAVR